MFGALLAEETGLDLDAVIFVTVPYAVFTLFIAMTVKRYIAEREIYEKRSGEYLEAAHAFWTSSPWHYGLVALMFGHLLAFIAPGLVLEWNHDPKALYTLELIGVGLGVVTLTGLVNLILRGQRDPKAHDVVSPADALFVFLLIIVVSLSLYNAVNNRWSSSWFAATVVPYLKSLCFVHPDVGGMLALPWTIKAQVLGGFAILTLLPFTRFIYILFCPSSYLWRRPQIHRA